MQYKLKAYALQDIGQRTNQEDSFSPSFQNPVHFSGTDREASFYEGKPRTDDRLFLLCDGMGGHEHGEVASQTVCQAMSASILAAKPEPGYAEPAIRQAVTDALAALDAADNNPADVKKMGTTMTCLLLHAEGATVAHIGDSRVYQFRPATADAPARIMFHTEDHSLVNDLVRIGEITPEEARNHPQKNIITRAMQPGLERKPKPDVKTLTDVRPGDYFFMCSDGMIEEMDDDNLLFIITNDGFSDEEKLNMLLRNSIDNKDNHTAWLVHIDDVTDPIAATDIPASDVKVSSSEDESLPEGFSNKATSGIRKRRPFLWFLILLLVLVAYNRFSTSVPETDAQPSVEQTSAGVHQSQPSRGSHPASAPQPSTPQSSAAESSQAVQSSASPEPSASSQPAQSLESLSQTASDAISQTAEAAAEAEGVVSSVEQQISDHLNSSADK